MGRPREFCRGACRQADYLARLRSAEAGLSEAELIVARRQVDDLLDRIYVLEMAVQDAERDLAESATLADHQAALAWVLEAARPLFELRFDAPPADGTT